MPIAFVTSCTLVSQNLTRLDSVHAGVRTGARVCVRVRVLGSCKCACGCASGCARVCAQVCVRMCARVRARVCDGFGNSEFGDHGICDGFGNSEFGDHDYRPIRKMEINYFIGFYSLFFAPTKYINLIGCLRLFIPKDTLFLLKADITTLFIFQYSYWALGFLTHYIMKKWGLVSVP